MKYLDNVIKILSQFRPVVAPTEIDPESVEEGLLVCPTCGCSAKKGEKKCSKCGKEITGAEGAYIGGSPNEEFLAKGSEDITEEDIKEIGEKIGIDWDSVEFTPAQLLVGINVEMEHGDDPETAITDKIEDFAKIAWRHLKELKDYYERLVEMEKPM